MLYQFVLADHPVAVFDQQQEKGEDLRLDRHAFAITAQFETRAVQFKSVKGEHQGVGLRHTFPFPRKSS